MYAGDVSDEDKQPRKKLDKGKGRMKVMPELPDDVWRRVFELYYDDVCDGKWLDLFLSLALTSIIAAVLHESVTYTIHKRGLTLDQVGNQPDEWSEA